MLLFLLCSFLRFVCCVVRAGFVCLSLFLRYYRCVCHCIYNSLGRRPINTSLLFFFLLSSPRIWWYCFFSWCPPRAIRVKYGPSATIWTLPCLLPVPPHTKLSHYTHPNHSRTSVSFRSCVCDFCSKCVFCLDLCLWSCVLCVHFDSCLCLFACLCLLLC